MMKNCRIKQNYINALNRILRSFKRRYQFGHKFGASQTVDRWKQ